MNCREEIDEYIDQMETYLQDHQAVEMVVLALLALVPMDVY